MVVTGPAPELTTDRLVLEPLRADHAVEMVDVLADESLYEFTGGAPPDLATLSSRYGYQVAGGTATDEQWFNWIIRLETLAVGYVQATVNCSNAEIAWLVGPSWQGRGIASEAANAMASWLKAEGVLSVSAHIHPSHRASQSVAQALGLTKTGEIDTDGEEVWSTPFEEVES